MILGVYLYNLFKGVRMSHTYLLKKVLSLFLLVSVASVMPTAVKSVEKENEDEMSQALLRRASGKEFIADECCGAFLQLNKLCATNVKATNIVNKKLCSDAISAGDLCAARIQARESICTPQLSASSICTNSISTSNLVLTGGLVVNQLQQCGFYRATAVFASDTPYVLGTPLNFDQIIDDPNNNVTLAPFTYTAPISGYYIVTLQFDQNSLKGNDVVLGVPIANLKLFVNNVVTRQVFYPFLTFHDEQKATVSGLISLKAGDKVTGQYEVYVMTDGGGFVPYTGTVTAEGNGTEQESFIKVHYLSSDCVNIPAQPCSPLCTGSTCNVDCSTSITCCPC